MYAIRIIVAGLIAGLLCCCAYLDSLSRQNVLSRNQKTHPSLYADKHLIERDSYFVYGRLIDTVPNNNRGAMAVAAVSDKHRTNELVDINYLGRVDSYYGLNLPEGAYRLLVLEDTNADRVYERTEVVGRHELNLALETYPARVAGDIDIRLHDGVIAAAMPLTIPAPADEALEPSLFFPKGSIRSLDDPVFSNKVAALGLYNPPAFIETAPMMFYALEEDAFQKVPVIFVHGIGGTVTQFRTMIDRLDRKRYKPWFFYYASGADLNQLATMFYDIFLSGDAVKRGMGVVIVAHSMGGLVVREALNLYRADDPEVDVRLFISIASPFGGMDSARIGVEHAPLVIPAWRDLVPNGPFIQSLFRKPLPGTLEHHLIYAYGHDGNPRDSDGVVPIASQLPPAATESVSRTYGFKASHAGIIEDPAAIDTVMNLMGGVKNFFPDAHLDTLAMGGFDVPLDDTYSEMEQWIIRSWGVYLRALVNRELEPIPLNAPFLAAVNGEKRADNSFETAWLKFIEDYPELAAGSTRNRND